MAQILFEPYPDILVELAAMKNPMALMHYHNTCELYYLLRGEREYFIGDEFYKVTEGDLVFIPANVLHRTGGKGASRYLVYFSDAFFHRFFTDATVSALDLGRPWIFRPDAELRGRIESDFNTMLSCFETQEKSTDAEPLLAGYLHRILFSLRCSPNGYTAETYTDGRIGQIVRYINENYSAISDIDQIADKFFLSKYHLCRLFSKNLGLSLITYLNTIKIRAACELMRQEKLTLTEIATRCGFNSSSYFCKVFKSEKGVSPTAYRKQLRHRERDQAL